jgi:rhodanese-related sulfurtransferase
VEFITNNVLLIGLVLGSGIMLVWPMLTRGSGGVANLDPNEAVLLMNRNNAIVLDVRDDAEFAAGHITDAKHIPLAKLAERIKELDKFKDKPVLVHCQAGVRSTKACDILRKNQFTKLHNLKGGLNAWIAAKLPVVKD